MKRTITIAALVLVLATSVWMWNNTDAEEVIVQEDIPAQPANDPVKLYNLEVAGLQVSTATVKRDQRFSDLYADYFVDPEVNRQISLVPREVFDFRKVTAGNSYTLLIENDSARSLKYLVYEVSAVEYVVFSMADTLRVTKGRREVTTVLQSRAGVIGTSLFETISNMNLSHELTNRMVDILAWQLDFQRLQKGDRFKVVFEELQIDGEAFGIGKIEAISFVNDGHEVVAVPFEQDGAIDYFDPEGKSLRKALLKYPIEFTRISSRYNLNRFHPVAKVFRAHRGTDFAAPAGTPIRSVGDGVVEEATYKANNGNYVKVRHNSTYTTQYLHMSRIASGMRPGVRVRQGEIIGFVGSTGLATGPHLCYRFWKNGVQVDALKVELPPSQPVAETNRSAFDLAVKRSLEMLNKIYMPEPPMMASNP